MIFLLQYIKKRVKLCKKNDNFEFPFPLLQICVALEILFLKNFFTHYLRLWPLFTCLAKLVNTAFSIFYKGQCFLPQVASKCFLKSKSMILFLSHQR